MKLTDAQVRTRLAKLPGWAFSKGALQHTYPFRSFPDAIAFVTRLGFDAQAADHHPDLQINYKMVTVTWSTHSEGGVTEKDIAGAKQGDAIAKNFA